MKRLPPKFFSTRASKVLAQKVADEYGSSLGEVEVQPFKDGEFSVSVAQTVRGCHVFLFGATFQPSDNLLELLMLIDLMKRASAKEITAVVPYYGWARQDRKDKARVPITAKLIANLIVSAGANRIVTMDLHADQIQGFFEIPVDHVFASKLYLSHVRESFDPDFLCVVSPDAGGSKRAANYAKLLGVDLVICHKRRQQANQVKEVKVIGEVLNKDVVIFDDIIDTAGTVAAVADKLSSMGVRSITVYATHALLSDKAYQKIEDSAIRKVWVTDTIPLRQNSQKISILSCRKLLAGVLYSVHNYQSVSKQNQAD